MQFTNILEMNDYKYTLDKSSRKYTCPNCEKKVFVRYIDSETKDYLPKQYGRCDREVDCQYHLNPCLDSYAKQGVSKPYYPQHEISKPRPSPVYYPMEILKETLKSENYNQNTFIQNLLKRVAYPFEENDMKKVITQYYLGTYAEGYMKGAITFPFIDKDGYIRTIQVKQFDEGNHTTSTNFIHSIVEKDYKTKNKSLPTWLESYSKNDLKVACLFGSHLLNKYPHNPIMLVEAPKTAIYGTLYFGFPDKPENFLWLAVYNLSSLNFEKCKVLEGRKVYLLPDLSKDGSTFENWRNKAKEFNTQLSNTSFRMIDFLEKRASTELKQKGADIADVLIRLDWKKFKEQGITQEEIVNNEAITNKPALIVEKSTSITKQEMLINESNNIDSDTLQDFSYEINELKFFFSEIDPPQKPIVIRNGETINDIFQFLDKNFSILESRQNKNECLPYLEKLRALKKALLTQ